MRFHEDERRVFWGDIFELASGDINLVQVNSGIPIAWHRHQNQDDRLFLVSGKLLVKWTPSVMEQPHSYILDEPGSRFAIHRGHWHGYEAIINNTIVLQFNGPGKWDGSDEERHPIDDEMPWIS